MRSDRARLATPGFSSAPDSERHQRSMVQLRVWSVDARAQCRAIPSPDSWASSVRTAPYWGGPSRHQRLLRAARPPGCPTLLPTLAGSRRLCKRSPLAPLPTRCSGAARLPQRRCSSAVHAPLARRCGDACDARVSAAGAIRPPTHRSGAARGCAVPLWRRSGVSWNTPERAGWSASPSSGLAGEPPRRLAASAWGRQCSPCSPRAWACRCRRKARRIHRPRGLGFPAWCLLRAVIEARSPGACR